MAFSYLLAEKISCSAELCTKKVNLGAWSEAGFLLLCYLFILYFVFQCKQMEEELKSVKGPGAGMAGFYKPMALPENMASTSAEVIASLNEHLVTVLQVRNDPGL